jgi:ABC-2 type transport system permease protein
MTGPMTTTNTAASPLDGIRLSFAGLLRSEWIKLRTLRSTMWCLALVIVLSVGFAALVSGVLKLPAPAAAIPTDTADQLLVTASTAGVGFSQLVAAVLGVLVISGEYTTGMIRSTFAAAPGRLGALFAKVVVLAVVVFVVALVAVAASVLVANGILVARGFNTDLGSSKVLLPLLGAAAYLALIAMLAFATGTLIRSSAGGIATIMGLLLVLPIALGIVAGLTPAKWVGNISALLPAASGAELYRYAESTTTTVASGVIALNSWQGGLVLLAWVVVALAAASVLVKRRDV